MRAQNPETRPRRIKKSPAPAFRGLGLFGGGVDDRGGGAVQGFRAGLRVLGQDLLCAEGFDVALLALGRGGLFDSAHEVDDPGSILAR